MPGERPEDEEKLREKPTAVKSFFFPFVCVSDFRIWMHTLVQNTSKAAQVITELSSFLTSALRKCSGCDDDASLQDGGYVHFEG